ncbi:MAG: endolytic transglycosylase MltG [Gammaproteobacteria bacterium]
MKISISKTLISKIIIFVFSVTFLMFASYLNFSFNKNINYETKLSYHIKDGASVSKTINELRALNIIDSTLRFKILAYIFDISPSFKTGMYRLSSNDTEFNLLIKFINGFTKQEFITIIEGSSYSDILDSFRNNKTILKTNGNFSFLDNDFFLELGINNPEGLCFPDTYKFASGITDNTLLQLCSNKMITILKKYWKAREYSLPYKSPYEMLIMASIIEKETALNIEKPIISSVFVNRLNLNMRLQADPTVIYGIKDYRGNITKKDLQANNDYNTYKIYGLPKTPICSPGEESIKAASRPVKSKFLYFVANKKGKHIFSEDYNNHVKAVNKYQK